MKTNVKKCLFGGALLGAGLCSTASAADVNWNYGNARTFTNLNFSADNFSFGSYLSWDANTYDGAHSRGGTFGFDMMADSAPTGYAYVYTFGYFTVAAETTLLLDWDIVDGSIEVSAFRYPSIMSAQSGESGSLELTFHVNMLYRIDAKLYDFGLGASSFSMSQINVVPLPPAAIGGLGMLAGLGAYRRVRR